VRTKPLRHPIAVPSGDGAGLYLDVTLSSDDEPSRRVWKVTLRTDPRSRGELLYQSAFRMPPTSSSETFAADDDDSCSGRSSSRRVFVPFDSFRLVRGPRVVSDEEEDGVTLDVSNGLTQVGLSLSKFVMGETMTVLEDFRAGYFDVRVERIGFYTEGGGSGGGETTPGDSGIVGAGEVPRVDDAATTPLLLTVLKPLAALVFSEKRSRRAQALKVLTRERGMSRVAATLFMARVRSKGVGLVMALSQMARVIAGDAVGFALRKLFTVCVFYPLLILSRSFKFVASKVKSVKRGAPTTE